MNERIRVSLSPYLIRWIDEVAKDHDGNFLATLNYLLNRMELLAKHGELPKAIGPDWIDAAKILNNSGMGPTSKDPVKLGGGEEIAFDLALLERWGRGFHGVRTFGSRYRALVPEPSGEGYRFLDWRPTPELAAIDRFKWYEEHALPYGTLGRYVADYRRMNPGTTVDHALELAQISGDAVFGFTKANLEDIVDKRLKMYGEPKKLLPPDPLKAIQTRKADPQIAAGSPILELPAPAEPEMVCTVCSEVIKPHAKWTVYGEQLQVVHQNCLNIHGEPDFDRAAQRDTK